MTDMTPALGELLDPFWLSATMHRESVVFAGDAGGLIEANLLFRPDEIVSVLSARGDFTYVEGEDYRIDRQQGRILRTPGSRMPLVASQSAPAADGQLTHDRTVVVTYTHPGDSWRGFVPAAGGAQLPRLTRRLERREKVTMCLTGDSISEGYDASGFHRLPPFQPPFGPLVAAGLQRHHGAPIHFHNFGTAGWTTADALWDTERIAAAAPDLVIIAFGMNDASYAEAGEYAANVSSLMTRVSAATPHAEFVLVSPMLPTPECAWLVHSRFGAYRDALVTLTGESATLADVTTLWTDLVARKSPRDLSGNGWNHPNDFGHRIYAQTILAVISGGVCR